jgi:hypothetical protein
MSSQGYNATTLVVGSNPDSGVFFARPGGTSPSPGQGVPTGIPTQFASDYTRRLKQLALYRPSVNGAPGSYRNTANTADAGTARYNNAFIVPFNYSIVQSNENRKSYQFARFICTSNCRKFPDVRFGSA